MVKPLEFDCCGSETISGLTLLITNNATIQQKSLHYALLERKADLKSECALNTNGITIMCAKHNKNVYQIQMYTKYKRAPNTLLVKEWCTLQFHHYHLRSLSNPLDKTGGKSKGLRFDSKNYRARYGTNTLERSWPYVPFRKYMMSYSPYK